ncbi:MAG TPA: CaiB/BaiF CoA-transferase family protein [Gammaproteobacteria bacterium]|jgi:formyl-CoA transferase|nr:CaiB/BaiF CoA-transferase family protein [Gammaproteobacteria bacterium]
MPSLLEGIRVVEVATFVFGPAAGTVLSDFGAEVIHVEPPGIGDPYRMLTQLRPLPECDENYCWLLDSRNKKSMVLDLKQDAGRDVLLDLVRSADVFITNYHPSVLDELRLTYEELSAENQRLIYAHATGYGEVGEEAEKPGYDATAWWARSGLMDAVRPAGGELALATAAMGDHPSAISVAAGIGLALYARERTGKGTKISTSLIANGAWANSILVQAALCGGSSFVPPTQLDTPNAMVNHYRGSDGRSFYLALIKEATEFTQFCVAIGRPELATDPRFEELAARRANASELATLLSEWFLQRTCEEWRAILDEHAITFGTIATTEEVADDEQMRSNGVFVDVEGRPGTQVVNSPFEIRDFPKRSPQPPPELGEHSDAILRALGYDDDRIEKLRNTGAVNGA